MAFEIEIRNAEIIERFDVVRMHDRGNIGAHMHRVTIYADQIAGILSIADDAERYSIVMYAIWHDMPEVITGDVNGPTKAALGKHDLVAYEDREMRKRWPDRELWLRPSVGAYWIVKVADMLDEVLWLIGEQKMGNSNLVRVLEGSVLALGKALVECEKIYPDCGLSSKVMAAVYNHQSKPWQTVTR